jgi:predicted component of type VI protein secretion system
VNNSSAVLRRQAHDELQRYNGVLARFSSAGEEEWEAVVAVYRNELQRAFFDHMEVRPCLS